jgi:hypothetical protein
LQQLLQSADLESVVGSDRELRDSADPGLSLSQCLSANSSKSSALRRYGGY